MTILLILVGIALVIWGADRLTEGASAIASCLGVPPIVIGLTVVAAGTSMPEFFISLTSALKGSTEMAVGNVVGSNIFNVLLIVGCAAAVAPMVIAKSTVKKDIPFAVGSAVLLIVLALDGEISRIDALLLIIGLSIFFVYTLRTARKGNADETSFGVRQPVWLSSLWVVVGLACLAGGSNLFVGNASLLAKSLGVSDAVIGLTIVAGGTSLPELATSVVAARKGRSAIAIGNVIGSNVMNVLMILGITGLVKPLPLEGLTMVDFATMGASIVVLWFFTYTRFKVERWEGFALLVGFAAYMVWLFANL